MTFRGRVGIQQRVLPRYRAPFFDLLAAQCRGSLSVFAGEPRPDEAIPIAAKLNVANWDHAQNIHFFGGLLYACYQNGLVSWLENWNPDALIVEANPRYLSTPAALRWMKSRNRPVIAWGLGAPPILGSLAGFRNSQRRKFLSQFDALIAYSQRGADEYRALGFPAGHIIVAPNSVAPKPISAAAPVRQAKQGPLTILYVGRLQQRKRLDSLLRACASLPPELQPSLVMVGEGPAFSKLRSLANRIYPNTEFAGARFGFELDGFFDRADLFVLPGTGGLAVQQAMAHGLPVIVAQGDGSQAGMVTPANGWLLPVGDDLALQHALAEALTDPARLRTMGLESFELVKKTYNLENMVAAFVQALNLVGC